MIGGKISRRWTSIRKSSIRFWATDTSPFLRNSTRAAAEAEANPGRNTVVTSFCSLMNRHSGLANVLRRR